MESGHPSPGSRALGVALGVAVAGLVLRIACAWLWVPAWEAQAGVAATPDAYPALAASLLDRGELGYGEGPTTARGPAFPAWLALGMRLGGSSPSWLGLWGSLPGLVLGSVLCWTVGRRFGSLAGLTTGVIGVLHPLPLLAGARVMGDDFYAALGTAALVAGWRAIRDGGVPPRLGWLLVAAVFFGAQILTRATGLLSLAAFVIFGLSTARRAWLAIVAVVVLALIGPTLWSIRSSHLEGRPVFVHSLFFYNFWIGEKLDCRGPGPAPAGHWGVAVRETFARAGWPDADARRLRYVDLTPRQTAHLESSLGRQARERVASDPLGFAGRAARGLVAFWFRGATRERTRQYVLAVLPVLALAAVGVVRFAGARGLGTLFALVLGFHAIAYALVLPAARLSVQVYPSLAYLAGVGAAAWAGPVFVICRRARGGA